MYLMPHTHIQIMNNHAKGGGGIYVEDNTVTKMPCFFQLLDLQYPQDIAITLENNTADEAGSAVYGGEIDKCYTNQLYDRITFNSVFKIIRSSSVVSQVSSNPVAVHACNYKDLLATRYRVYPGHMFQIPVVLYGRRNGSVPGTVHCEFLNKSRGAHFAPLQETQKTGCSCRNLTYTIFSAQHLELIRLRVDGVIYNKHVTHIVIHVTSPMSSWLPTVHCYC